MKKRKLFWQFFGAHILILVVAVGLVSLYTWQASRTTFVNQWIRELQMHAQLTALLLSDAEGEVDTAAAKRFLARIGRSGEHRFTLVLPDGKVLGDTEAVAEKMESHKDRPEIAEALKTGRGMSERYSASVGKTMLYLAQRIPAEGPAKAVVRISVPMRTLTREMDAADRVLVVLLAVVLCATLALSYLAARRIVGPVSELQKGLSRIGEGDLECRLNVPTVPHLAELARSINQTADRLQKSFQALSEERNLRALILANMTRGVIAIDSRHVILDLNGAARRLLSLGESIPEGTRIGEVVRYPELLSLIEHSEGSDEPVEREMVAGDRSEVILNMRATALRDVAGGRIGTLLVLGDVSLLRRLETVRQDFVANVSHELRTPVTSIKGFAETLLDGALAEPATAERFLKIIVRQANQLEVIIRDLLDLSRLEQHSSHGLEKVTVPVAGVLKSAVELCQSRADEKGVKLCLSCPEHLVAVMHAGLMEQAVVNLIDNAIKYGINGGPAQVDIAAVKDGPFIRISVRDYGHGIEHKHLERLFERFYRVDKGRSRELGGTGLGLAIVKHIALIHNGTASVESELGSGATFTIRLPV